MLISEEAVPTDLVWHETSGQLELAWADGRRVTFSSPSLRTACKCAGCEKRRRDDQPLAAAPDTTLTQINPIGDMGVQLVFSDGHDRGIYPWPYLHQLAMEASP